MRIQKELVEKTDALQKTNDKLAPLSLKEIGAKDPKAEAAKQEQIQKENVAAMSIAPADVDCEALARIFGSGVGMPQDKTEQCKQAVLDYLNGLQNAKLARLAAQRAEEAKAEQAREQAIKEQAAREAAAPKRPLPPPAPVNIAGEPGGVGQGMSSLFGLTTEQMEQAEAQRLAHAEKVRIAEEATAKKEAAEKQAIEAIAVAEAAMAAQAKASQEAEAARRQVNKRQPEEAQQLQKEEVVEQLNAEATKAAEFVAAQQAQQAQAVAAAQQAQQAQAVVAAQQAQQAQAVAANTLMFGAAPQMQNQSSGF